MIFEVVVDDGAAIVAVGQAAEDRETVVAKIN